MGNITDEPCVIWLVMENAVVSQRATLTADGDVEVGPNPIELDDYEGSHVWCETHQERIYSGTEHRGKLLHDEWEIL